MRETESLVASGRGRLEWEMFGCRHENFEHVCDTGEVANREEEILDQGRTEKRL